MTSTTGFGPGQPSRTSIVVAALRAFGAREPDPSVRNPDLLAEKLISDADLQLISEHPIALALREDYAKGRGSREIAGMSNMLLIRTRFIDDHMKRALADGAKQLVILGAGFDTRAYRFLDLLKDVKVFEVDYRSTQEIKKLRLAESAIAIPQNLHFAEIDFKKDELYDVLRNSGYQPSEKTFFIWEGVSMYLNEDVVRRTLRTISRHSGRASSLVMDFAEQAMIDLLNKFPRLSQHNYTTAWGEPWTFGLPDTLERNFFLECGFELREIVSFMSREASARYLTRADGTKFGSIRGGPPQRGQFATALSLIWMFLTRKSRWYALAKLDVA